MQTILPYPEHLELLQLSATTQCITAIVCPLQLSSECPLCHHSSTRIHSRYVRHLLDLPWHHVSLRLELHVRRFFCGTPDCSRQIFTERLPELVAPSARRTKRLDTWFTLVGFALGGKQERGSYATWERRAAPIRTCAIFGRCRCIRQPLERSLVSMNSAFDAANASPPSSRI